MGSWKSVCVAYWYILTNKGFLYLSLFTSWSKYLTLLFLKLSRSQCLMFIGEWGWGWGGRCLLPWISMSWIFIKAIQDFAFCWSFIWPDFINHWLDYCGRYIRINCNSLFASFNYFSEGPTILCISSHFDCCWITTTNIVKLCNFFNFIL